MFDVDILPKSLRDDIRELRTPQGRRTFGQCIVEGVRACEDVLASPHVPSCVVLRQSSTPRALDVASAWHDRGIDVYMTSEKSMAMMTDAKSPQDLLAVVPIPQPGPLGRRVVALDRITDPGNAGTIIRTAAWFGCTDVVFGQGSVDPYSPKVVRSCVASLFRLGIQTDVDLEVLLTTVPHTVVSTDATSTVRPSQLPTLESLVLLLGSEAHGVAPHLARLAHHTVAIGGGGGMDSLNVAVAGSILLYEWFGR